MAGSVRDALAKLKMFEGVDLDALEAELAAPRVHELAPGGVLLTMGQPNLLMYVVVEGRLSVHLEGGPESDPVAFIGEGETVGELSVLDESPASAHVVAADPSRVLAIDGPTFWGMVNASHAFAKNLLVLLAGRLRANNSTVSNNIRLQREYARNAMVDALTGLYNRRWLDDSLARFATRFARSAQPLAVLMIDVDHFKRVNDTYGHLAGDAVLVHLARITQATIRTEDVLARYGGEEFAVICRGIPLLNAGVLGERIRSRVEGETFDYQGTRLPLTISVGVAALPEANVETASALVQEADGALYDAKRSGRNRVCLNGL